MKTIQNAFLVAVIFLTRCLHAQDMSSSPSDFEVELQALESTTPLPASQLPDSTTWHGFYTIQHGDDWPPFPADMWNLNFWPLGNGWFVLDDRNFDYEAVPQAAAGGQLANGIRAMNGSDGFSPAFNFSTSNLWLEITGVSTDKTLSYLVIHPPSGVTNGIYDLYATINLNSTAPGLNGTNWVWLMRCAAGQTNLTVTNFSTTGTCFFQLGTTNDTDNDGLPDAYEKLVLHTDPNNPDSDGDGLADGLEVQMGFDPNNAYSQDSTHNQKDGAWYLMAITGQSHTKMSVTLDTVDSYYDSDDGVTVLYFPVSGVTTNDQFHIYIQTPSVDPHDTNFVWQDMFADMGYTNFEFIEGPSGPDWVATFWPGNVPLDGSVKFAAVDSQDRDFDGLPDGYEVLSAHTIVGAPSSDNSGTADGDVDIGQDNLSNVQKYNYGLNPLLAVSNQDSLTNGLPDWMRNYITFWDGSGAADPWADPDGDEVPNIVEYDLGTDPVVGDFWFDYPPPPGDESQQFVSIQIPNVPYSDDDGPYYTDTNGMAHGNLYFPTASFAAGPLGIGLLMTADNTGGGDGIANFDLEISPLDQAYDYYAPFTATADPGQNELQEPDQDLYRQLLSKSTDFSAHAWAHIEPDVLEALSSKTLEYVDAVSMMKVQKEAREIQWLEYEKANGANGAGIEMQIEKRASIIHTESTKITAVNVQYLTKYPNLDWFGRVLNIGGFLAFSDTLDKEDIPNLEETYQGWQTDIKNHQDTAGPALFSSWLQQTIIDTINAVTLYLPIENIEYLELELSPDVPIFDPNPLGWYDGGSGD